MKFESNKDEILILRRISNGDKDAFAQLFNIFYNDLVIFSTRFTHNIDISEEIVQAFFVRFWEERNCIVINTSIKSYFLKSIQNSCLDWKRHRDVRHRFSKTANYETDLNTYDTESYIFFHELESTLEYALGKLKPDDAEIFKMNRFEGLTYSQIAEKQKISLRVVELRISKVLRILRLHLREFKNFFYYF